MLTDHRGTPGHEAGKGVDPLVAFTCVAAAHRDSEAGPDKLTIHNGKWAYCAYDAQADGHDWKPADGVTVSLPQPPPAVRDRTERTDLSETP